MTPQRLAQIQSDFDNSETWTPTVVGELLVYIRQLRAEVGGGDTAMCQMQHQIEHLENEAPRWCKFPTKPGKWVCSKNNSQNSVMVEVKEENIKSGKSAYTDFYGPIPEHEES